MKLVTHDKTFHYDDVLATAVLMKIYPGAEVVRSRNEEIISEGDIVYDVGGVYDPARHRYDHHQKTFNEFYSSKYDVKLSSAGLIFKHFHVQLFEKYNFTRASPIFDDIVEKIYMEFFLPADAIDNGYDSVFGKIKARTVADVVKNYNIYRDGVTAAQVYDRFMESLDFVSTDLDNYLTNVLCDYAISYERYHGILKDFNEDIFITENNVSLDLLYELDEKLQKDLKFIVMRGENDYRIVTIPVKRGHFAIKYPLNAAWRGLSGEKLEDVSGIPGCVFVHSSGFTGGNKTLDGALEMCRKSLNI